MLSVFVKGRQLELLLLLLFEMDLRVFCPVLPF